MSDVISFVTKVVLDTTTVEVEINKRINKVQKVLDAQILKDSNYYCPMYTGNLMKSGINNTVLGSGRVIWNTPYAKEQYYNKPNKSHQHNPNATTRWFEKAKARRMKEWEKLVNDQYRKVNK